MVITAPKNLPKSTHGRKGKLRPKPENSRDERWADTTKKMFFNLEISLAKILKNAQTYPSPSLDAFFKKETKSPGRDRADLDERSSLKFKPLLAIPAEKSELISR